MNRCFGKRILYVIGSLGVGGTETHLLSIARAMVADGMQVYVYSLAGKGALGDAFEQAGVNLLGPRSFWAGCSILTRAIGLFLSAGCLGVAMIRLRPEIVHFFLPVSYLIGAPLAILTRRPIRIMSRRSMNNYQLKMPALGRVERHLHRAMTAILTNSDKVAAQLHDEEGVPYENMRRIYNGVDLSRFETRSHAANIRQKLAIGDRAFVMTTVANIIPYKGHEDLIEAFKIARESLPADWRLLIVGRDDGIGAHLRAKVAALGLSKNVLFLGSRSDIPALLLASDVGLLCSHEEGFSNAILEGMAAGLPMIVTDVGGNTEAVIDGETGIVVPAHAPDRIAAAIVALSKDAECRKRFGAAARRRAEKEFSSDSCSNNYRVFYSELCSKSASL